MYATALEGLDDAERNGAALGDVFDALLTIPGNEAALERLRATLDSGDAIAFVGPELRQGFIRCGTSSSNN